MIHVDFLHYFNIINSQKYQNKNMELKITKELKPCPVCGHRNIIWGGYYYLSLICKDCYFEMWPLDDFAPEEDYYEEWNNLDNLDNAIKQCKEKLQKADKSDEKKVRTLKDLLLHYESLKKNMEKAHKNLCEKSPKN